MPTRAAQLAMNLSVAMDSNRELPQKRVVGINPSTKGGLLQLISIRGFHFVIHCRQELRTIEAKMMLLSCVLHTKRGNLEHSLCSLVVL